MKKKRIRETSKKAGKARLADLQWRLALTHLHLGLWALVTLNWRLIKCDPTNIGLFASLSSDFVLLLKFECDFPHSSCVYVSELVCACLCVCAGMARTCLRTQTRLPFSISLTKDKPQSKWVNVKRRSSILSLTYASVICIFCIFCIFCICICFHFTRLWVLCVVGHGDDDDCPHHHDNNLSLSPSANQTQERKCILVDSFSTHKSRLEYDFVCKKENRIYRNVWPNVSIFLSLAPRFPPLFTPHVGKTTSNQRRKMQIMLSEKEKG